MKFTRLIGPFLGLATILSLTACGGGSGGGTPPPPPPPPPAPTAVTSVGTITGFGSVWINGIKYEVEAGTIISIEGQADRMGDDSVLKVGMTVNVKGQDDNGVRTAQSIGHDEDLRGPVSLVMPDGTDPTTGTFNILDVVVTVDSATVFDNDVGNNDGLPGIDIRDLQNDMIVEVSGFPTGSGTVLATRVDRQLDAAGGNPPIGDPNVDGDELEIKGFVDSIDDVAMTITVNGVTFDVGASTVYEDGLMLNADLVGVFVEVKADLVNAAWFAVRVEREDDFGDGDRSGEFEMEGILQSVDTDATPNTFTMNGQTIPVTDASSLVALVGQRVEIKGSFNANNVLVLGEAQPDLEDDARIEDLVVGDPADADTSFTTRLGIDITPTGASRVRDDTSDNGDHLTPAAFLALLADGDRIEARGHQNADGSVTWTGVEREDLSGGSNLECQLRGPVSAITGDETSFTFVIQGVTVSTDGTANSEFKDENDSVLGRAAFFTRLTDADVVEARSFNNDASCMPAALDARQVEFEPAD